jgi:hypothetical protein
VAECGTLTPNDGLADLVRGTPKLEIKVVRLA